MKRYLELNGEQYRMKNIDELTYNEYLEFQELLKKDDEIEISQGILKLITKINEWQINAIQYTSLFNLDWTEILQSELTKDHKVKSEYIVNRQKYNSYNLAYMKFSTWIDINYILPKDKISMVVALVLQKGDYSADSIAKLTKNIEEDMPMSDVMTIYKAFLTWRESIHKQYTFLFRSTETNEDDEDEDDIEDDIDEADPWLTIAYSLTNEDITKKDEILNKGIVEILNWLSYLKEKRDEERDAQLKNSIKH